MEHGHSVSAGVECEDVRERTFRIVAAARHPRCSAEGGQFEEALGRYHVEVDDQHF